MGVRSPSFHIEWYLEKLRDHPKGWFAARDSLDIVKAVAQPRDVTLERRSGEMRREYDVVELEQRVVGGRWLLVEYVEAGAKQIARTQSSCHRLLVDDGSTRGIDDDRGLLHQREFACADQVACRFVQRHMQRENVGMAQDFGQKAKAYAKRVFLIFPQSCNIVVMHRHAEGLRQARHLLSDGAEAHDPQHLAAHFMDGQRSISVPAARCDVGMLADEPPRNREHQ